MKDDLTLREMQESDRDAVMRIFNYYAKTSFAAYPDGPLPSEFFVPLREGAHSAIVLEGNGVIAGFGLLKPFLPFPVFRKTGMLTYFLDPDAVGKGLGSRLLERLEKDAKKKGITMLIANMSSKNEESIRFHKRHGFGEAGNLFGVGEKFGEQFGVIWMQKSV
jgi:phosphinothricin acetyltransferase